MNAYYLYDRSPSLCGKEELEETAAESRVSDLFGINFVSEIGEKEYWAVYLRNEI